jgi:hypothetical protein
MTSPRRVFTEEIEDQAALDAATSDQLMGSPVKSRDRRPMSMMTPDASRTTRRMCPQSVMAAASQQSMGSPFWVWQIMSR